MIDIWLDAEDGDASGMALITLARNSFLPTLFVYGDLLAKGGSGGDFARHAADYRTALNPPGSILTGEVDDSLYTYEAVNFDAGQTWGGMAKTLLASVLAVIVVLAALGWFVLRRVRRRRTITVRPALRNAYS